MSDAARAFMDSRLAERYFMGAGDADGIVDFSPFTFRGLRGMGELVAAAEQAAAEMLGAAAVSLSCLSGIHAMMTAILSTTEPGDAVMSVDLAHGGHFATQRIIERVGRRHVPTAYNFDTLAFDVDTMAQRFADANARALYLDVSFYLNPHNLREIRAALGPDAVIIYDASHTMGLIMGGLFQDPFREGANVICGNTHKTLPGPQKGLIAFRDTDFAEKALAIINSGLFSSSHTGSMIALATTLLEMRAYGEPYAAQIVTNSNALGDALDASGYEVRRANTGRYSENHQVHLIVERLGERRDLYLQLLASNISVNFDQALGGETFIRLGTQEVTRRGMKEPEMADIAELLRRSLSGDNCSDDVRSLVGRFGRAAYSFDEAIDLGAGFTSDETG